jgi:hypothetical protein
MFQISRDPLPRVHQGTVHHEPEGGPPMTMAIYSQTETDVDIFMHAVSQSTWQRVQCKGFCCFDILEFVCTKGQSFEQEAVTACSTKASLRIVF